MSDPPKESSKNNDKTHIQAPKLWADVAPRSIRPYIELSRIDLFAGSLMIFWPCAWSLTIMASDVTLPPNAFSKHFLVWLFYSIILHSSGSTWNDICDADIDRQIERTKDRPLARGAIGRTAALIWTVPQIAALLGILASYNKLTLLLGAFQIFFLTGLYPFMKRVTYVPHVWLGLTVAWGAILAWTCNNEPDWRILVSVVAAQTIWITYTDTLYAMLDKKDDPKAGVKSMALLIGSYARPVLALLAVLFLSLLTLIGLLTRQGVAFYFLSVLGAGIHLGWQIVTVDMEDQKSCIQRFKSNPSRLGYLIWGGMVASYCVGPK